MKLDSLSPNLMTDDMSATMDFYTKLLGFERRMSVPEEAPYNWVMLARDEVTFMFQTCESIAEDMDLMNDVQVGGSLAFYINVTGVEEWYERVKGNARIFMDMQTTFYGAKEFGFYDNNGYLIVFAEHA